METLDLNSQKVAENIYFYDGGLDSHGVPIIYHAEGAVFRGQPHYLAVDRDRLEEMYSDAPYPDMWMKGIIGGMAWTALIVGVYMGLFWVAGKLYEALGG